MVKVLVVEDDRELNNTVCGFLSDNGFEVKGCLNAKSAYDATYETVYDLIISDVMMPETDGFEFAENIRAVNKEIPILFMTGLDDIGSKKRGFALGIDDYLTKPIDLEELLLHINALLRRAKITAEKKLTIGSLTLDSEQHSASLGDEEIQLTTREFDLLFKLLSYPKKHLRELSLWTSSGMRKAALIHVPLIFTSPVCATSLPTARILRS